MTNQTSPEGYAAKSSSGKGAEIDLIGLGAGADQRRSPRSDGSCARLAQAIPSEGDRTAHEPEGISLERLVRQLTQEVEIAPLI
jgi:hypothetical protein